MGRQGRSAKPLDAVAEALQAQKGYAIRGMQDANIPNMKLAEIAHYGARGGKGFFNVPYGYTMSMWGNCTGFQSRIFGARDLPIKVAWHPCCDPVNDIRPISHRGALRTSLERAAGGRNAGNTLGLGPVGMDFWVLPADPAKKRRAGALKGGLAGNLSMSSFTTAALLAPGPNGPLSRWRAECPLFQRC